MTSAPYTYKLPNLREGKNRFEKVFNPHDHYKGMGIDDYLGVDEITGASVPKAFDTYTFNTPKGATSMQASIGFTSPYGENNSIWIWFNDDTALTKVVYQPAALPYKQYLPPDTVLLDTPADSKTFTFTPVKGQNQFHIMGWESAGKTAQPVDFWIELESVQTAKEPKAKKSKSKSSRKAKSIISEAKTILDSIDATGTYKEYSFPSSRLEMGGADNYDVRAPFPNTMGSPLGSSQLNDGLTWLNA